MSEAFDPRKSTTAFDQASTVVLVLELSGKSWRVGASVPGLSRRPLRNLAAGDIGAVLEAIERWEGEANKAGCEVGRVVAGYEAGLDGFWIARALRAQGVEVYVMHPASVSVERRGRRAKTDRIDLDIHLADPSRLAARRTPALHNGADSERDGGGHPRTGATARGLGGGPAEGRESDAQPARPVRPSPIFGRA